MVKLDNTEENLFSLTKIIQRKAWKVLEVIMDNIPTEVVAQASFIQDNKGKSAFQLAQLHIESDPIVKKYVELINLKTEPADVVNLNATAEGEDQSKLLDNTVEPG